VSGARALFVAGCALGFVAVAAGAFGAHALRDAVEPRLLEVWETGARYALGHAPALLAAAALQAWRPSRLGAAAGGLLLGGALVFSGSLGLMTLTGQRWLGAITPLGGLGMLGGWLCLGLAGARALDPRPPDPTGRGTSRG
jgi:uncharacterized membrane protein YgdD (TMEM256/DUF423 family)